MYLARFAIDDIDWVQGLVRIELGPRSGAGSQAWWAELSHWLRAVAQVPAGTIARRVSLDRSRRLTQTVSIGAPSASEREVREALALSAGVERRFGGEFILPTTRDEHDAALQSVPPLRFCTSAEAFSVAGLPLACDLRVAPSLDALLIAACEHAFELSYQIHLRATVPEPSWVRLARKNVVAIAELPGVRAVLVEWQDSLAESLEQAAALSEEFLAVRYDSDASWVTSILLDAFRAQYIRFGFTVPGVRFPTGAHDEPLLLGIHSHELEGFSPVDVCSAAVTAQQRDHLVAWQPSTRLRALLDRKADWGGADVDELDTPSMGAADEAVLPEPCDAASSYAFVSYKRQDLARIAPILRDIVECGLPVWYDRGIPGGAEWDEVIEDRLARCRCVVLFASPAAIASKYVRREVKFADALDTPILCVMLEASSLSHGMRMLLSQYQMLEAQAADFPAQLRRALRTLTSSSQAGGTEVPELQP